MWKQTVVTATITQAKMFEGLVNGLLDTPGGFVLHDDMRSATVPYIVLRNNLGGARDMYLHFACTITGSNVRVTCSVYQTWDASAHTGTFKRDYGYSEVLNTSNVTVNVASSPDKSATALYFTQGTNLWEPWVICAISPHRNSAGAQINTADDGSQYPQWGFIPRDDGQPQRLRIEYHKDFAHAPDSVRLFSNQAAYTHSLFFGCTRNPLDRDYLLHTPGYWRAWTYGYNSGSIANLPMATLPARRVPAWAGTATQFEGFRPHMWTTRQVSGLEVDDRGLAGLGDSVLMSASFGAAVGSSFTVGGSLYRVVYASQGWDTQYRTWDCALAIRVQ